MSYILCLSYQKFKIINEPIFFSLQERVQFLFQEPQH